MTPIISEREAQELLAQIEGGEHGQRIRLGTYGMSYVRTDKAIRAIVAALTREQREDDALADTQRAIIEAAEQRGYERGKAEWRQQVKDAWDNLSIGKVDKPKDTGRFA